MGQDDAHQAIEDHGSKRHGTVLLSSKKTKDTVINTVKVYTLECGYRGCAFQTGDCMPSTIDAQGYHKCVLEDHFGQEHTVPPL